MRILHGLGVFIFRSKNMTSSLRSSSITDVLFRLNNDPSKIKNREERFGWSIFSFVRVDAGKSTKKKETRNRSISDSRQESTKWLLNRVTDSSKRKVSGSNVSYVSPKRIWDNRFVEFFGKHDLHHSLFDHLTGELLLSFSCPAWFRSNLTRLSNRMVEWTMIFNVFDVTLTISAIFSELFS